MKLNLANVFLVSDLRHQHLLVKVNLQVSLDRSTRFGVDLGSIQLVRGTMHASLDLCFHSSLS